MANFWQKHWFGLAVLLGILVVGLATAVTHLAHSLSKLPQQALAASKQLVYAASQLPVTQTNQLETKLFVDLWSQPDHLEALAAFREKRAPVFGEKM